MSTGTIQCFFLVPETQAQESYRRYVSNDAYPCHLPHGYHDAIFVVGRVDWPIERALVSEPPAELVREDPRWPKTCLCGFVFRPDDPWQHLFERLYQPTYPADYQPDPEETRLTTLRTVRPGAMWYADWYGNRKGPDGHTLIVRTPAGDWAIDGPASNGPGWTRTGTPPLVTATPSIGFGEANGGWRYHAFLTDGKLIPV